jgi:hypothetical protein
MRRMSLVGMILVAGWLALGAAGARGDEGTWKAGTAKAVITPKEPMWMAGYAARTRPAEGTLHELYLRVLALEDGHGKRAVILSSDLLGISRSVSENVSRALREKYGLSRDEIMLNASHTHSGPVLRGALYDAYPLDPSEIKRIEAYSSYLEATIVRTVGEALGRMVPATLARGEGSTDFAVNRRNNREPDVPALRAACAAGAVRSLSPRARRTGARWKAARGDVCLRVPQHDARHPAMERRLCWLRGDESRDGPSGVGRPVLHGLRSGPEPDPSPHG